MNEIPQQIHWEHNLYGLDEEGAYRNLFGKSKEEAYELILERTFSYQEDVSYTYGYTFEYYVEPYLDYLLSDDSKEDSDAANCFLGLIEIKLSYNIEDLLPHKNYIEIVLDFVSKEQFSKFDADKNIYGLFREKVEILKTYLNKYPSLSQKEICSSIEQKMEEIKKKNYNKFLENGNH